MMCECPNRLNVLVQGRESYIGNWVATSWRVVKRKPKMNLKVI